MKIGEMFPSKYLKACDFEEGSRTLTIERVEIEMMENTREDKPVLYFVEIEKALVLNVTNGRKLGEAYGDDSDMWIGRKCVVFATETEFAGKTVPCVRIGIPRSAPEKKSPADEDPPQGPISTDHPVQTQQGVPF